MYFLKENDAKELKLDGLEFEIGKDKGILVEDAPYEAKRKEMSFKDELEATELEGIVAVKKLKFPEAPRAAAPAVASVGSLGPEIIEQANKVMKENIKLLQLINKLKK
jgi:hypothetical protein